MTGSGTLRFMDRIAAVMRGHGMHPITRAARNLMDKVNTKGISIVADELWISGSLKDRAFLYSVEEGRFEPSTIQRFKEVVMPGMVVLDAGAYLGYYSVLASRLVGPRGKIFSFEPNPGSYHFLGRNVAANHCANVITYKLAVSSQCRDERLYLNSEDVTRTSLFLRSGAGKSIRIESTTVDEVVGSFRVDIAKIDVEGAELLVLEGMKNTIEKNPDIILFMELNPVSLREAGTSPVQLMEKLYEYGFTHITRLDEEPDGNGEDRYCNLFCSRQ